MPLHTVTLSPSELTTIIGSAQNTSSNKPAYVVFYASLTDGRSWCGDCRDAEPFVNKKFESGEDVVRIVYVGQRTEWKNVPNPWKEAPFSIQKLPTLLKIQGGDWKRLVEEDVYDQAKLDAFVK